MRRNCVANFASIARLVTAFLTFTFISSPQAIRAQTTVQNATWLGGNGSWLNASSWDIGVVPFNGDVSDNVNYNVFIDGGKGDHAVVTLPYSNSIFLSYSINNLTIDSGNTLAIAGYVGLDIYNTAVINNSGTINFGSGTGAAGITFQATGTLEGGGVINLYNNSGIGAAPPYGFINKDNTIQGYGQLENLTANGGTINANTNGQTLSVQPPLSSTVTNTGLIEATNGGTLSAGSINNAGGLIHVGAGSVAVLAGTTTGGTLSSTGTGQIQIITGSILDSVTITSGSTVQVNAAGGEFNTNFGEIGGTITNHGTFNLVGVSGGSAGLFIGDVNTGNQTVTLQGGGTINLSNAETGLFGGVFGNVLNNVDNTIQGQGVITTNLINGGTVSANVAGAGTALTLSSGNTFTNNGTFAVASGATLQVNGTLTNYLASTSTLSGGTYNVSGFLTFGTTSGAGAIATNDANILINGPTAEIRYLYQGAFHDALAGLSTNAAGASLTFIDHNFTTAGNFTNDGTLIVDPSTFTVHGDLLEGASSVLGAHIDGLTAGTQYDQFLVTGTASLSGTLDITFDPGFTPALGESFALISYTSATGQFSSIDVTGLPSGLGYTLQYGPNGVTLDIVTASVPAPGSMTLLLTGGAILGLASAHKRRNANQLHPIRRRLLRSRRMGEEGDVHVQVLR
jgi:fibronectin-binding autotransporter adhesin